MKFDPDKFLAEKEGFDPDAFLAENTNQDAPSFVEEMGDVSFVDRARVKNFGSQEGGFQYLQKQYPDLEFQKFGDRTLMRPRGSQEQFKVLDPDTGFFSTDFARDGLDVVTDIAQGMGEGAATAAGAIAGGISTGGVGALPAGIAAGGAAGAGLETLKQGIGKYLGVRDNFDTDDIAMSSAFGAASPLFFGTGAGLKQGIKQGVKSLTADTGKKSLKQSVLSGVKNITEDIAERGIAGRAKDAVFDKVAPLASEFTSGIKADVWRKFKSDPDAIAKMDNKAFTNIAIDTFDQLESNYKQLKQTVGKQFQDLEDSGVALDLSDVQAGLKEQYEAMLTSGDTISEEIGKKLKQTYDDAFTSYGKDIDASFIPFEEAQKIKNRMGKAAKFEKNLSSSTRESGIEQEAATYANDLYGAINDKWDESLEGFSDLRSEYKNVLDMEEVFGAYKSGKGANKTFKEKAVKGLMGLESADPAKIARAEELMEVAKKLGIDDIEDRALLMGTYKALKKAPVQPVSGTATSTSRTISNLSLGSALDLKPSTTAVLGTVGLGPAGMKKAYETANKAGNFGRRVQDLLPARSTSPNVWRNLLQGQGREEQR